MKRKAIFDNGGGITLQLGTFAHHYATGAAAAIDWTASSFFETTDDWEGHDEDAMTLDPSYDDEHNGGYLVCTEDDINTMISSTDEMFGSNVQAFIEALQGAHSEEPNIRIDKIR